MKSRDFFSSVLALTLACFAHCSTASAESVVEAVSLKVTTLQGMEIRNIPSNSNYTVYVHFYNQNSGEELRCNVDFDLQKINLYASDGALVSSAFPQCRTNLGGIVSTGFSLPSAGTFQIVPIPVDSSFKFLPGSIVAH